MLLYLQIIFTVLSALCLAAAVPVGAFLDWAWALACGLFALLFFGLMLLCKQSLAMRNKNAEKDEKDEDKQE